MRRERVLVLFLFLAVVGWAASPLFADPVPESHGKGHEGKAGEPHGDKGKAEHHHDPKDHVMDQKYFELLESMPKIYLPQEFLGFIKLTKFKILILIAAALILIIYIPLARRAQTGEPPRGMLANAFEGLLTFIRDEVAKPNLGTEEAHHPTDEHGEAHVGHAAHHPEAHDHPGHAAREPLGAHAADKYVPFLWTLFLFILFCNLLGMFPYMGSPTANIWVTGALALIAFFAIQIAAIAKMGLVLYLKSLWPPLDIPIPVAGFVIKLFIMVIELIGIVIKSGVLAVRLFANMFAGHMVLATILLFIKAAGHAHPALFVSVTAGSVLGVVALSLLELFVAFLQAYIFTFLTALFMGMAVNPQH